MNKPWAPSDFFRQLARQIDDGELEVLDCVTILRKPSGGLQMASSGLDLHTSLGILEDIKSAMLRDLWSKGRLRGPGDSPWKSE